MNKPLTPTGTLKYIDKIDGEIRHILGDEIPLLSRLKTYTVESGGKRVRSLLAIMLAELYGLLNDEVFTLAAIVEIIHAASLLHDDVLDNSVLRRGRPSGKELFGSKEVILGGDYMLACAIRRLSDFDNRLLMDTFTRVIRDLSISELIQMEYASNSQINMEIYFRIIYGKTASLFQTACESVAIYSEKPEEEIKDAGNFGKNLGLLFQIRDDYLDYFNKALLQKTAYQDYENGYYTYPVLSVREKVSPETGKAVDAFFQLSSEERKKKEKRKEFLNLLNAHNSQSLTREKINELFTHLENYLSRFPDSGYKAKIENQINNLMKF